MSVNYPDGPYDAGDAGFHLVPGAAAAAAGAFYAPARATLGHHKGLLATASGAFAADRFGQFEADTAGLAAGARVSGQSISALRQQVRALASDLPIGVSGAAQYVGIVTQLGVVAAGSEPKVGSLAKVLAELNGATGTGPAVALGFGQLNKQLASLNPQRVRAFSDSLVTLQAKGGGSAEGIVAMARSIAPFAAQAGIGETAVLGIASSFTKLGDEGTSASTAVGRVLSDISRSVKTGSADINGYAAAVGMTAKQFRALYQANPTAALERVVSVIGSSGGRGAEFLATRGLDGTRSQRALLQLSQSGDLASQIRISAQGYGSGATQSGAHAAFDNLSGSLTRVRTTAGEATAALGGPFAHALTFTANLITTVLKPIALLLNSTGGQIALDVGVAGGVLGLLAGKGILGGLTKLGPAALATQAVRSGPVGGAVAGYRDATGAGPFAGGWRARAYNPMMAAARGAPLAEGAEGPVGPMGVGATGRLSQRLYNTTYGFAQGLGLTASAAARQETLVAMLARRGVTVASGATAGYLNLMRAPFRLAYEDPRARDFAMTEPGGATRSFGAELGAAARARDLSAASKATRDYIDGVGGAGVAARRVGGAFLLAGKDVGSFAAKSGFGIARGVLGSPLVRGIGSLLTGPAALLGAGYAAYSVYNAGQKANARFNDQTDIYAEVNKLNDSLGLAGQAALTFADQAKAAAAALGVRPSPTKFAAARHLTAAQIASAGTPDSSMSHTTFRGSDAEIAAQVEQVNAAGLTPAQLSKVGTQLYQQGFNQQRVNSILGLVKAHPSRLTRAGIAAALRPAAASDQTYKPSTGEDFQGSATSGGGNTPAVPGINKSPILMSDTAKALVDRLIAAMAQQYATDVQKGGPAWALQNELRTADMIQRVADSYGQDDLMVYTAKSLSAKLTGTAISVTPSALRHVQGDIVGLSGDHGHRFSGQTLAQLHQQGITLFGPGAVMKPQPYADAPVIASTHRGGIAASALTSQSGAAGRALGRFQEYPEDTEAMTRAQRLTINAMRAAGGSWQQIANSSSRVAANVSDQDPATYQLARAMESYAQSVQADADRYKAPGVALGHQVGHFVSMTQERGPKAAEDITAGQQGLRDTQQSVADTYRARLMAQLQYQIASDRAAQDYQRSTLRAQQDYQRQSLYAQQDYERARFRTVRDYNIQIKREVQDAGTNMYDPYARIPVEPVWDVPNLVLNERETVSALRQQLKNIKTLKQLGMTETAIRQLKLYDPTKQQQVAELVSELRDNQREVGQLNQVADQRQNLGGQLLSKSPDYQRSAADFRRGLRDTHADYTRQTDRMASEFALSMSRAAEDQQRALTRMAQDLHNADLQITGDFNTLQHQLIRALNGQQVNWNSVLVNGLHSTIKEMHKLAPSFHKAFAEFAPPASGPGSNNANPGASAIPGQHRLDPAGGSGSSTFASGRDNPAANRAAGKTAGAAVGWTGGQWHALDRLWGNESGWSSTVQNSSSGAYGIPQGIPSVHPDYAAVMRNGPAAQIAWGIHYIKTHHNALTGRPYGTPQGALDFWNTGSLEWNRKNNHPDYGHWYGTGAIFTTPQRIGVGDHGRPEAVIPLDRHGAHFMAEALRRAGVDQIPEIVGGGGRAYAVVVDHSVHHVDQGLHIDGPVTVQADDPREFARQLEEQTRRDNLTGAVRGSSWSR